MYSSRRLLRTAATEVKTRGAWTVVHFAAVETVGAAVVPPVTGANNKPRARPIARLFRAAVGIWQQLWSGPKKGEQLLGVKGWG